MDQIQPETRVYYTRTAPKTSVRVADLGDHEIEERASGVVVARVAPMMIELDGQVRSFDALFARSGRAGIDDYGWMYADNWLQVGAGANFLLRGHDWQEMPGGAGGTSKYGADWHLIGDFRAAALGTPENPGDPAILDFLRAYNVGVKFQVSLEVSMGFFVLDWRGPTPEEEDWGVWFVVLKGDLVEVSYVFRGAVPDTELALRESFTERTIRTTEASATIGNDRDLFARADEQLRWATHQHRMEN